MMSTVSLTEHSAKRQRYVAVLLDVMSRPSGAIGLSLVVFHVCLAIISPVIVPYDFKLQDASLMLSQPSNTHWLGADHLGRDIFSRTMLGGREALSASYSA